MAAQDLKSTLDGVDFVKGNNWVKPEKKDKEKEKKDRLGRFHG